MNCKELRIMLDRRFVPRSSYSLSERKLAAVEKNDGFSLLFDPEMKTWEVIKYRQGEDISIDDFYSEAGACEKLYFALTEMNKDFWRILENLPFEDCPDLEDPVDVQDLKESLIQFAGIAEPRLVTNVEQLKTLLREKGVPRAAYSILGDNAAGLDQNGGRSLEYDKRSDSWYLWVYGRGEIGLICNCFTQSEACSVFYYLLVDGLYKTSRRFYEPRPVMNRITGLFRRSSDSAIRNCDELETRLIKERIRYKCALPDDPPANGGWTLEYNQREKTWDLFYFERGTKELKHSFYWESTACEELYSVATRFEF